MRKSFLAQHPSVLYFMLALAVFTLAVTLLSEATGVGLISTSFVKTLGKTLWRAPDRPFGSRRRTPGFKEDLLDTRCGGERW
ncbi:MAG: hypothetical protein AAFQ36_14390, partial [Pseudomonadota bacterium]